MKRGCEQEEDLSELLQFLDDEVAGPSNDGDSQREPELEPKHTIFLSHSGVQKNFTEQLCVDLERWDYSPFFDKRPDSLPKGRKFPELIFQASRQCRVAILVLSEEFFTRTKWPMLELEAFVEAQENNPRKLSILPVYLGLSQHECTSNKTRRAHWLFVWRGWAQSDDRIDVGKWEEALKVLGPSNGIEYVESSGEVALREQIVSAVRGLIPPESSWSGGHVQGKSRILKAIINKFKSTKPSPFYGVRVVGLYGMGGFGKTTFCRALCDELSMKFQGRVCHAELGSKSPIELHKEVLRRLTDINHDRLTFESEAMIVGLLRRRLRQQQLFLALDNVWQESLEQAKVYLRAGFHHGSILMVTACSIDILGRLNINESDCLEMPGLEAADAKQLFLQFATPGLQFMNEGDEQNIQKCIKQCRFRKGANMEEHFHPFALKILGAQLGSLGCDPSVWVENLSKDDKFNQFREKEHPIFKILRKGYDSLPEEDQLLFMDVVLFHPSQQKHIFNCGGLSMSNFYMRRIIHLDIYKWLSMVHNLPDVQDRLQALKARSLIEDIGDGFNGVIVHDLYLEFAKSEVKRGALDGRRWVWYDEEAAYPADLVRSPSGNCWSNVERIFVKYFDDEYDRSLRWMGTMEGMKWQQFSNVVVLQLFIGRNEVLDLQGLQCLKSLELSWGYKGRRGYKSRGQLIGLGELRNLAWLNLRNIHFAPCFQEIGQLTRLEVLRLETNCFYESPCSEPLEPPNLDNCIQLLELVLQCTCLASFPDLSKLTSLRKVLFDGCKYAKELVGLSSQMTFLQELLLLDCNSLSHCPGLSDLVSLQQLDVECCYKLSQTLDLHKLTNLHLLNLRWTKFNKLLGLNDSMPLQDLRVECPAIDELPNLHLLRHLQVLHMSDIKPTVMPRFDRFMALEVLILIGLPKVRHIHGMRLLTSLKRLTIHRAFDLLQLPELGDEMALQYLCLHDCCHSVLELEFPDLHNLIHLEVLAITGSPIRRLPSLERLTQLRELDCSYTLLTELPVLNGLDKLESINLGNCRELTSLEKVGSLPTLISLELRSCSSLPRLPDLRSCTNLEFLSINKSGVSLGLEDIRTLATLPALEVHGWNDGKVLFSKLLEVMSLVEVASHLEAKRVQYFNRSLLEAEELEDFDTLHLEAKELEDCDTLHLEANEVEDFDTLHLETKDVEDFDRLHLEAKEVEDFDTLQIGSET